MWEAFCSWVLAHPRRWFAWYHAANTGIYQSEAPYQGCLTDSLHMSLKSDLTALCPTTGSAVYGFQEFLNELQRNWTVLVGEKKSTTILSYHKNIKERILKKKLWSQTMFCLGCLQFLDWTGELTLKIIFTLFNKTNTLLSGNTP